MLTAFAGVTAYYREPIGEAIACAAGKGLHASLVREAAAVARGKGIALADDLAGYPTNQVITGSGTTDDDLGQPPLTEAFWYLWRPDCPAGTYSTLAGFVEPGASLEEAVAREVFEEAGIRVNDVTYEASQPWPFPASRSHRARKQNVPTATRCGVSPLPANPE